MTVELETPVEIKDLLAKCTNYMKYGGIAPKNRTKLSVAFGATLLIIQFFTFILQGIHIFVNNYEDNSRFMYDMTLFVGYWQFVVKCWTLFVKHKAILKLVHINNTNFWTLDLNILTKNEKQKIQTIYDYAKIAVKIYTNALIFTLFAHFLLSCLRGKKNLILNIWLPKDLLNFIHTSPGHEIFIGFQGTIMFIGIFAAVIQCDCFFIIVIAAVIAQIRILKIRLNLIGDKYSAEENVLNLIENIKQHNYIFEYLHTIEEIFSQSMLQVLGSNMSIVVLSLFSCLTEENISNVMIYIPFISVISMQLYAFCLVGQFIQDETLSIAEAAYQCNWQDVPNKNVRFMIMMIITRAQRQVNITMGGVFILCLETFTGISRTLLSFLTFMLNVQNNKK